MPPRAAVSSTDAKRLTHEVGRLAKAFEKQNDYHRRFLSGVVFGVGTAIGASVIATLIILLLSRIFSLVGLANVLDPSFSQQLLEQQLHLQSPTKEPSGE